MRVLLVVSVLVGMALAGEIDVGLTNEVKAKLPDTVVSMTLLCFGAIMAWDCRAVSGGSTTPALLSL